MKYKFETDEKEEAEILLKASDYKFAIDEIWERCFRPNNKHGYNDPVLDSEEAYEVIEKLIDRYHQALEYYEVK
jgi:hypothetical protein